MNCEDEPAYSCISSAPCTCCSCRASAQPDISSRCPASSSRTPRQGRCPQHAQEEAPSKARRPIRLLGCPCLREDVAPAPTHFSTGNAPAPLRFLAPTREPNPWHCGIDPSHALA